MNKFRSSGWGGEVVEGSEDIYAWRDPGHEGFTLISPILESISS